MVFIERPFCNPQASENDDEWNDRHQDADEDLLYQE